jgi:hypothetical protein
VTININRYCGRVARCYRTCIAMLAVFALGACGGVTYLEQPRTKSIDLSGQWHLANTADAELKSWIDGLVKKHEQQLRKETANAHRGDEPPAIPGQFSNLQWMYEQNRREVIDLTAWLMPATQLDIKHTGREMEIRSNKEEGTRRLVAGESTTLFMTIGSFDVASGWSNDSYMVRSSGRQENNVQVVAQYTLRPGSQQLEEQMEVYVPMIGKRKFTFVYDRR